MPLVTDDTGIKRILAEVRRIAVVGLSSKTQRPSHGVARAMMGYGYGILPVNPNETEVLGQEAVADLSYVSAGVGMVDVFRAPEYVPQIVQACIDAHIPNLWLQEGVVHDTAAQHASDAGIHVVMDRCMLKEYRRLMA